MAIQPVPEKMADKVATPTRADDKPIDEKRPTVPYALVAAYPIILILALFAALAYFFFLRG